ncbi:hypothetical protein Tco_0499739 [Tanacetum coccineum]
MMMRESDPYLGGESQSRVCNHSGSDTPLFGSGITYMRDANTSLLLQSTSTLKNLQHVSIKNVWQVTEALSRPTMLKVKMRPKPVNLHHKIHTMKQNGSTLADYYHNLNALWKQFDCLFLMGLDDSYMSIRSSTLSRDPLPDVRNAYATISSEESHRVIASSMSDSSQRTQTAAFASNAPNRTVFQREKKWTKPKGKSVSNNSVSGSSSSSGFTDEQLSTLITLIKDNSVSGKSVQANMAVGSRKIVDSGANQHMTDSDKGLYNVHDISHLKIKVGHPNGTETFISKIGTLKLPSSVLNGKSPFELIYNTKPNLSNLRVFGCLCFATVLNNHDKLGSRSEKCVMMGYSSVKKDSVPKVSKSDIDVCQDVNHLNFFDLDYPEIPCDDNEIDPSLNNDSSNHSDSSHSHVSGENDDIIDIPDSGVETDNNGHNHATHDEQVTTLEENTSSEGNEDVNPMTSSQGNQNLRRSSRVSVFPRNYNDFVVESKVKYGLEKFVGHANHDDENMSFVY